MQTQNQDEKVHRWLQEMEKEQQLELERLHRQKLEKELTKLLGRTKSSEAVKALEDMKLFAARLESGIQMRLVPWDGMTEKSEIAHYYADEILKAYRAQVTKEGV